MQKREKNAGKKDSPIHYSIASSSRSRFFQGICLFFSCLLILLTSCHRSVPSKAQKRDSLSEKPLPYPFQRLKNLQYTLKPLPHPPMVGHNLLEVEVMDLSFRPAEGLKIKITAKHLSRQDLLPYTVLAKPSKEKGVYEARMAFPASGKWRLTLLFISPSGGSESSTLDLPVVE